ncbi:MAG: endonuclease/exonuclease/phosphatase family protein [Chitinophagaceae bacterium]
MSKQFYLCFGAVFIFLQVISAQEDIRVMSFNIRLDVESDGENRWELRKGKVAGLMNYHEADFIGGQEVLQHQLNYLLNNLENYASIGVGRDDGREEGEYSCIFYKKEKFTLLQSSTFWLSPWPDSVSFGWGAACRRICTYGLFRSNKTGQQFWVFNTHLDHISANARLESARLIVRRIGELNTGGLPVVLTGDFNSRPEDEPCRYILQYLRNARTVSEMVYGEADTWNGFKFSSRPEGCIDYVFISANPEIRVRKFATITDSYALKYPSDHFPVMATISIEPLLLKIKNKP